MKARTSSGDRVRNPVQQGRASAILPGKELAAHPAGRYSGMGRASGQGFDGLLQMGERLAELPPNLPALAGPTATMKVGRVTAMGGHSAGGLFPLDSPRWHPHDSRGTQTRPCPFHSTSSPLARTWQKT